MKNVVIAQSGGPTSVINNSIRGAIDELISSKKVDRIYGCLLYTSPSPRDRTRSRMPSSA